MQFRVLGPLEAGEEEAPVALGPLKQRALLALLLLDANHALSVDRLIEGLWGDAPPENAVKAIQTYVSRLRKVLPEDTLCTRPHGYAVELDPGDLDLHRFESLLDEGRRALAEGRSGPAAATLQRALELWRGAALAEFGAEPFAATEGPRLEELRLLALEERVDAELALGRHADLVGELESLVAHHPLRERFRLQLMLALYRAGRQPEALAVYREARALLVDELGIEPSRRLHNLEAAILRQDTALDLPGSREQPPPASSRAGSPFVGREYELERLISALEDAVSGRGRLVLVSGEQGIGKTRIAMELAEHAERRTALVLWGRCYEREGSPPYWPWVQVIRTYLDRCDPGMLGAEMLRQAATVAEIVPEVRERFPGVGVALAPRDPKQARFQLLDSVASFLKRAAAMRPLTIVLDDLHAADAGSLLILEFVARELADARVLVLGTYRDVELKRGHHLVETLAELTREHPFERLALGSLNELEVVRLVEASLRQPPPPGLAQAVHRQAEGNPLFVTEVIRLFHQERALAGDGSPALDWHLRVPDSVRAVIGRRLDQLSAECNVMLRIASLVGREFELRQLRVLVDDAGDDALLELLQQGLGARIIEELEDSADRYRFTHRLIQETLVTELSTTERVRLHARIAEALEQLYGASGEAHAAELLHHFAEAQTVLGREPLVRYACLSGEQALVAHSYDEAYVYFRRALEAKEGQPTDDETAAALFGLGRSEFAGRERYDLGEALGHMRRAFAHFEASGDERRAVEVAAYQVPYVYGWPEAADLAVRALQLVEPSSGEAGQLLSTLGWFRGMTDYAAAREAFERSTAIARERGDTALERRALVGEAHVDFWHLEYRRCLDKGLRAAELSRDVADERTEMMALSEVTRMYAALGEPGKAEVHARRMVELADKLRERYWLVTARVNRLWLTALTGDWDAARALSDEGLSLQGRDARNLASRALVEAQVGDRIRADAFIERLMDARWLSAPGFAFEDACVAGYLPIIERVAGTDTRLDQAEEAAETVYSTAVVLPLLDLYCRVGRSLAAIGRGDSAHALEQYRALIRLSGTAFFLLGVTADRLLGLLASTAGDLDAAVRHFEEGLRFCQRTGYRPEYAWTAVDYAHALLLRSGPNDAARATTLRADALAVARQLGMLPLVDRLLASNVA